MHHGLCLKFSPPFHGDLDVIYPPFQKSMDQGIKNTPFLQRFTVKRAYLFKHRVSHQGTAEGINRITRHSGNNKVKPIYKPRNVIAGIYHGEIVQGTERRESGHILRILHFWGLRGLPRVQMTNCYML